jgi:hypothetical protein
MVFLLCLLGIIAGGLLVPILWNIKKMTGVLRPLVENNRELYKNTVKSIPSILENIGCISRNSRDITDQLRVSGPEIIKGVGDLTISAKGGIEAAGIVLEKMGSGINDTVLSYKDTDDKDDAPTGLMVYVPLIKEIIQVVDHAISAKK